MSKSPDFIIAVLDKTSGNKNPNIGAGWNNSDGSITIKVDLGCTIQHSDTINYRLFPNRFKNSPKSDTPMPPGPPPGWQGDKDDDIPF